MALGAVWCYLMSKADTLPFQTRSLTLKQISDLPLKVYGIASQVSLQRQREENS